MGYLSDQEGIMNRYLREKENWEPHLTHSKNFINESFRDKDIQSVAVLGSGWLLDVPIKSLSKRFKKVLLLDINHPAQIRKKVEGFKNVTLQELDLTGGAVQFAWKLRKKNDEFYSKYVLEDFQPQIPKLDMQPDALISLNLLNQLDIHVVDFIRKKHNCFMPDEYRRFRRVLQEFHINWISKQPGCLISDMIETTESADGETTSKNLAHADMPEFSRAEEWIWDFDLSGTYTEKKQTRFTVRALEW